MAIPVYNGGQYLLALLESVHAQSYPVHEVVISDDGSSDDGLKNASEFLQSAGIHFRILQKPGPPSVSGNYENAIAHCEGDLIFLADQDDVWDSCRCAQYVKAFADPAVSLVAADSSLVDQQLRLLGQRFWLRQGGRVSIYRRGSTRGDVLKLLRARVVAHQIACRSGCIPTLLQRPEGFYIEDWASWAAELSGFCQLINQPLTLYRQHELQTSRRAEEAEFLAEPPALAALLASLRLQEQRMQGTMRIWQKDKGGLQPRQASELERKLRRLSTYRTSLQARIRLFDGLARQPSVFVALALFSRALLRNLPMGPLGWALSCRDGLRLMRWSYRQLRIQLTA